MRFIKHSALAICAAILFSQCFWKVPPDLSDFTRQFNENETIVIVANANIEAGLQIPVDGDNSVPVSGTISLYAETSLNRLKDNDIDIKGFNVVFFDVNQKIFFNDGRETISDTETGTFSMFTPTDIKPLTKYDPVEKTIEISFPVKAHISHLDEYSERVIRDDGKPADYAIPITQEGQLSFNLRLTPGRSSYSVDLITSASSANIASLNIESPGRFSVPAFKVNLTDTTISALTGNSGTTVKKTLCVQRVNIAGINNLPQTGKGQGKGFQIGWNGVLEQWTNKGGIEFELEENWNTVGDTNFRALNSAERGEVLRTKVPRGRCIPIIFVDQYDISGGGDTNPIGVESAKVVTSDNIGANNITHLAHEMGHVLGLGDFKFFTLMCASGRNDNPRLNSLEHILNVRNTLIRFNIAVRPLNQVHANCNLSSQCGNGRCPF